MRDIKKEQLAAKVSRKNGSKLEGGVMQEIIREYGAAILTVIAITALVALIIVIIGKGPDSIVGKAFETMISSFFGKVNTKAGL